MFVMGTSLLLTFTLRQMAVINLLYFNIEMELLHLQCFIVIEYYYLHAKIQAKLNYTPSS